jgi:hypothetical protein
LDGRLKFYVWLASSRDLLGDRCTVMPICLAYLSLNPNWTANPASTTANACWSRLTALDEFIK